MAGRPLRLQRPTKVTTGVGGHPPRRDRIAEDLRDPRLGTVHRFELALRLDSPERPQDVRRLDSRERHRAKDRKSERLKHPPGLGVRDGRENIDLATQPLVRNHLEGLGRFYSRFGLGGAPLMAGISPFRHELTRLVPPLPGELERHIWIRSQGQLLFPPDKRIGEAPPFRAVRIDQEE